MDDGANDHHQRWQLDSTRLSLQRKSPLTRSCWRLGRWGRDRESHRLSRHVALQAAGKLGFCRQPHSERWGGRLTQSPIPSVLSGMVCQRPTKSRSAMRTRLLAMVFRHHMRFLSSSGAKSSTVKGSLPSSIRLAAHSRKLPLAKSRLPCRHSK